MLLWKDAFTFSPGNGIVSLGTDAPEYPIVFAGPALAIEAGSPVAIVAGSSVAADTLIGVEGLAANAAATLFTNAEATFDVSKITVKAMHNTVLLGTAAAATFADGTVSTAGVPDYDDTAWLMPFIKTCALIWLDASDAANFTFKDKTFGYVTGWTDLSSYKHNAKSYMANYGSLDVADATVTVTDGEKDYSDKFKLVVRDGRLALANASPGGMAIILR